MPLVPVGGACNSSGGGPIPVPSVGSAGKGPTPVATLACVATAYCDSGMCVPKKGAGAACNTSLECSGSLRVTVDTLFA